MASDSTLPCSAVISEAISLRLASISSRRRNSTSARRDRLVARHAGNAALAAATAASTSSTVARATDPVCSPVAGLYTGPVRPEVDSTILPSIQWWISFISHLSCWANGVHDRASGPERARTISWPQCRYFDNPRFTNRPWPLAPVNVSFSRITRPRLSTVSTLPSISNPS
jgi:hypothetical protein